MTSYRFFVGGRDRGQMPIRPPADDFHRRRGPMLSLLRGDLLAFAAGFRQADRDGLLPALDGLATAAALERALLALVHRPLDVL